MSATPRLFVPDSLAAGETIRLDEDQAHYLRTVLRLSAGAPVRVFNGRDGEFEGAVELVGKRDAGVALGAQMRAQHMPPDLWLLFAPLKKTRTDFVVEKAVELGVLELHPVLTERTDTQTVRTDRLQRIAQEAAEQTERLDVPPVREAAALYAALRDWDPARRLWFCDEAGDETGRPWGGDSGRAGAMLNGLAGSGPPAAILIGPEGGFSPAERDWLRGQAFVRPIGLGPRILRAETAAVAALTLWQAACGDWR
jgi:16S rRNA (uracil1498-N3)-methyltransferase